MASRFPWRLWLVVFVATVVVATLIQLVLLPMVIPSWDSGEGVVDNCLDCASYHRIAVNMAAKIRQNGWSAWELRPEGQSPAGLAAALYATTVPRLWTMIPVNAAVHATTVALLFLILTSLGYSSRKATLGAIPFGLFPSSALWYAQLMKDGFFFLGFFLYVRGWLSLMQTSARPWSRAWLWSVVQGLAGGLLLWLIRPEMVKLVLGLSFLVSVVCLLLACLSAPWKTSRLPFFTGCLLTAAASGLVFGLDYVPLTADSSISAPLAAPTVTQPKAPARDVLEKRPTMTTSTPVVERATAAFHTVAAAPARLTAVVIRKRQAFLSAPGASSLDLDVRVETFLDLIAYLPRAARNAFLSPFPWHWIGRGTYASTTSLRRVCGLEMLVVYFALCFVPIAVWRRRGDVFIWAILLYSGAVLVVLGVMVNNWGTLYRLRYGYLMLWVGIGLCGFLQLMAERRERRKSGTQPK